MNIHCGGVENCTKLPSLSDLLDKLDLDDDLNCLVQLTQSKKTDN